MRTTTVPPRSEGEGGQRDTAAVAAAFYACYKCTTSSTTKLASTDNPAVGWTEPAHHKGRAVGQRGLAASRGPLSLGWLLQARRGREEEQVQHNKAKPYTQGK